MPAWSLWEATQPPLLDHEGCRAQPSKQQGVSASSPTHHVLQKSSVCTCAVRYTCWSGLPLQVVALCVIMAGRCTQTHVCSRSPMRFWQPSAGCVYLNSVEVSIQLSNKMTVSHTSSLKQNSPEEPDRNQRSSYYLSTNKKKKCCSISCLPMPDLAFLPKTAATPANIGVRTGRGAHFHVAA